MIPSKTLKLLQNQYTKIKKNKHKVRSDQNHAFLFYVALF